MWGANVAFQCDKFGPHEIVVGARVEHSQNWLPGDLKQIHGNPTANWENAKASSPVYRSRFTATITN